MGIAEIKDTWQYTLNHLAAAKDQSNQRYQLLKVVNCDSSPTRLAALVIHPKTTEYENCHDFPCFC